MSRNKILMVVAAVLALVFLVLPRILGSQIEKETTAYFQNIYKTTSNKDLEFNFERGWFSSDLTIEFPFPKDWAVLLVKQEHIEEVSGNPYRLHLKVYHGPFIFGGGAPRFGLALFAGENSFFGMAQTKLKDPFTTIPFYSIKGLIDFSNRISVEFDVPAFESSFGESSNRNKLSNKSTETTLSVEAIHLATEMYMQEDGFAFKLFPFNLGLKLKIQNDKEVSFRMEGVENDVFYTYSLPYPLNYSYGKTSILAIKVAGSEFVFQMSGLKTTDFMSRQEDAFRFDFVTDIAISEIGYFQDIGEEPQVTKVKGSMELLNLDGEAVIELMEVMEQAGQELSEEATAKLHESLEKLLAARPEYNIPSLEMQTKWGSLTYSQRIIFPAIELGEGFGAQVFTSQMYILINFHFSEEFVTSMVDLTLDKQLAAMNQKIDEEQRNNLRTNAIQQFIQAGYLVEEEGGYSMAIELKDGITTINGTPQDLLGALQQVL